MAGIDRVHRGGCPPSSGFRSISRHYNLDDLVGGGGGTDIPKSSLVVGSAIENRAFPHPASDAIDRGLEQARFENEEFLAGINHVNRRTLADIERCDMARKAAEGSRRGVDDVGGGTGFRGGSRQVVAVEDRRGEYARRGRLSRRIIGQGVNKRRNKIDIVVGGGLAVDIPQAVRIVRRQENQAAGAGVVYLTAERHI